MHASSIRPARSSSTPASTSPTNSRRSSPRSAGVRRRYRKARTFQPEDSDQVYTSIRPESIATVDADTRDRWVVGAAEQTVERIGTYAGITALEASGDDLTDALLEAGVENGLAAGIPLAQRHYGTTPSYLGAPETVR